MYRLKTDNMKKQFLLLTVLLFLLGACAPKPAEHSFIKVNADGQFVRDGKPYYFVGTNFWYGAILGSEGEGGNRERLHKELDFLPRWETAQLDLPAAYAQRMSEVGRKGYGMFAKHHVFTVENGQLVPVKYPDPQRLSELPGYEKEREKVIANTRALLAGMPPTMCCCTVTPAPASPAR